jgi:hypothetical protein
MQDHKHACSSTMEQDSGIINLIDQVKENNISSYLSYQIQLRELISINKLNSSTYILTGLYMYI